MNKPKSTKWILYAPTWRNRPQDQPLSHVDLIKLNAYMRGHKSRLFIALHSQKVSISQFANYSHITFLTPGCDLIPHLKLFDTLVTDYSSIFVDFLPLLKPIFFYQYDLDTYAKNDLGLMKGFRNIIPGKQVTTVSALMKALTQKDTYRQRRLKALPIFYKLSDGQACKRLDKILAKIDH